MFRSGGTRPAHARSTGSETLLRIRSLAGYIIGTLESRSRKRQPYFETSSEALSMLSGLPRWVSILRLDNEYCDREPRP